MLNDAARALLYSNAIAQLITINVDGSLKSVAYGSGWRAASWS
jgi:hypothetical protein